MTASNIFDPRPTTYYDENEQIASGAKAYFFEANTNTPLTVYTDQGLTTPHTFPVIANSRGVLPVIYLPYVDYRVLIRSAADITIYDAPYVPNQAPPASGGGITVTSTQIFRTGFAMWLPATGPLDGFVRMNGRTIGNTSSGATEYAGASAQSLFTWLWTNQSNSYAPVSTGRGASAADDWVANKTIVVPSMQGRIPVGADDMGGTAANVIQVSTTANVTNAVNTITVSSASGLARGMTVILAGVASGTITAISGTTVTLSASYAGSTATGVTLRASFFGDAQAAGAPGGSQTITQTTAELAQHNHTINDPGHSHLYKVGGLTGTDAASGTTAIGTPSTLPATTGITINNAGQALPTQIIQPGMIGTFYIKL